jgi:DNA-binding NtrC family response regulator
VLPLRLPALRQRPGDLDALAEHLLEDIARRSGMVPRALAVDALDLLARQPWPGNIRELRNVLEQVSLMTDDLMLSAPHFARVLAPAAGLPLPAPAAEAPAPAAMRLAPAQSLPQAVAALERALIRNALQATGGNKQAAARQLGIARATLYEKLAAMGGPEGPQDIP